MKDPKIFIKHKIQLCLRERYMPQAKKGTKKWKDFGRNKEKSSGFVSNIQYLIWHWTLDNPLREQEKSGGYRNVSKDKYEAVFKD